MSLHPIHAYPEAIKAGFMAMPLAKRASYAAYNMSRDSDAEYVLSRWDSVSVNIAKTNPEVIRNYDPSVPNWDEVLSEWKKTHPGHPEGISIRTLERMRLVDELCKHRMFAAAEFLSHGMKSVMSTEEKIASWKNF